MSPAWLNFAIVISAQFLLFVVLATFKKRLPAIPEFLGKGAVIGLFFGLSFDLILGKIFGLHSYLLGFGLFFLILNAALSYGLFSASMLTLKEEPPLFVFAWSFLIMSVYEATNHFFRVWTWEFSLPPIQFLTVLAVGYFAGSVLVIVAERVRN